MDELQLTKMEIQQVNKKKAAQNTNDTNDTTQARFGKWHGERYSTFPRAFRKHGWMFRDKLNASERELILYLWSFKGPKGIYPSLESLSDELGMSVNYLCTLLNKIGKKDPIKCPVCKDSKEYRFLVIESGKPEKDEEKKATSNKYYDDEFLAFLEHVDKEHFGDEPNLKDKSSEERAQLKAKIKAFRKDYKQAKEEWLNRRKEKHSDKGKALEEFRKEKAQLDKDEF